MRKRFRVLFASILALTLAGLIALPACQSEPAQVATYGYVRDYVTASTPTNLTGALYGTGSLVGGANISGVTYSNNGTAPTVATAAQMKTSMNIASGNVTFGSGDAAKVVTHSLGTVPVFIITSWMSDPGGAYVPYTGSANTTMFTVTSSSNVTGTPVLGWIAGY